MKKGFTLLEVLLVVAIIAILAGIILLAINPNKQLGDSRNTTRRADVNTLINAIYQYSIDHNGSLPTAITTTEYYICQKDAVSCSGYANLSELTTNSKYLVSLPVDPSLSIGATSSAGYTVRKTSDNRVTVSAPYAEQSATIQVIR